MTGRMVGPEGRRLLAQGREAELYEWDHGRVLRLLRDPGRHDLYNIANL